jgi:flagella basal body P-ring formation protein FlgA
MTSHAGAGVLKFALALSMGLLCLTAAQAQAQGLAPSPAASSGTGHDKLLEATRQWVAQTQQLEPAKVRFAALDSRVKVEVCEQALEMDYPFNPSRDTVRVRCPQTKPWQLFLRLLPAINTNPAIGTANTVAFKSPATPLAPPISPAAAAANGQPAAVIAPVSTRPVVVTRRLVQRGTQLDASVLEVTERPAQGLDPLVVSSLNDVERAEAVRDIPAGTVLRSYDIKRTLMVKKGQNAMLTVGQGSGFMVRVGVEAQQDGHMGEQIRLKNTESGRLLSGVVTGPNAVRALQN